MSEFHPFTLKAASDVLSRQYNTHDSIEALALEWGYDGIAGNGSIANKWLAITRKATQEDAPRARTVIGDVSLARAMVHEALKVPEVQHQTEAWTKLVAGLRFDGFEIITERVIDTGVDLILDRGVILLVGGIAGVNRHAKWFAHRAPGSVSKWFDQRSLRTPLWFLSPLSGSASCDRGAPHRGRARARNVRNGYGPGVPARCRLAPPSQ